MRVIITVLLCAGISSAGYAPGFSQPGAVGHVANTAVSNFNPRFSNGPDFNPILLQGNKGYPGIRARINSRAFQYASGLIGDLLNTEIKNARIPPISQCIPMVQGCIQIYNLYVSRYRCPQRVVLYPAAPNKLVLQVQNVDLGVTGNLGGQIVVLVPIALSGIVQLNVHQATITVQLTIERGPNGPYMRAVSCDMTIGYADAYIENGGLVGDIVNSQFRSQVSNQVRQMIPGQVCGQLPTIINEKINSRLAGLPQSIALTQMLSLFGGALGLGGGGGGSCPASCQKATFIPSTATSQTTSIVSPPAAQAVAAPAPQSVAAPVITGAAPPAPQIPTSAYQEGRKKAVAHGAAASYNTNQQSVPRGLAPIAHGPSPQLRHYRAIPYYNSENQHRVLYVPTARAKRQAVAQQMYLRQMAAQAQPQNDQHARIYAANVQARGVPQYQQYSNVQAPQRLGASPRYPPPPTIVAGPPPSAQGPPPADCSKCAASGTQEDPASFLRQVAAHLDMTKLNDIYLGVQLLNSYATNNDYTIDLTGEFSPYAQGGTPFGAFPTQFPSAYDNHMAEFIVTDFTVNSLFYHLHRKQFLSFRIGPETPKIGELLKTTCSDDSDDLEATEVELDEEETRRRRRLVSAKEKAKARLRRGAVSGAILATNFTSEHRHVATHVARGAPTLTTTITTKRKRDNRKRGRRQEDTAGLADLGICFGDILPAVREKYPNQKIVVQIRTTRAPSVILSAARGGMATLDLIADADIYIDGTNTKVGTITIAATVVLVVQINGNRLSGTAEITQLKLTDQTGTLGLPQDALDNLGNLGKELLQKVANDGLQKGITISIPQNLPLPIGIVGPYVRIIEHGLYVATDFTISPSLLGGGGSC